MASWKTDWPGAAWNDLALKQIGERAVLTYRELPASLYHTLVKSAARFGAKSAIVDNQDKSWSYHRLLELTDAFAACLHGAYGVRKGDHVGLLLYNGIEFCVAFLALSKLGAVTVPLPGKYKQPEILSLAEKADVTTMICEADYYSWFRSMEENGGKRIPSLNSEAEYGFAYLPPAQTPAEAAGEPDDPAIIMFTSGTTSQSKGVLLKNYNIMHAIEAYRRTLQITEEDRSIIAVPIYHITGMVALLGLFLSAGGTLWLHHKVDAARMLQCAIDQKLTFIHASPTVFHLLLEEREHFPEIPSLRSFACGSSNMPSQSIRKLKSWLPNVDFHTVYGLTETSSPGTIFPISAADSPYIGSSGVPIPGVEVKIVNEHGVTQKNGVVGEILVHGAVVLENYYRLETKAIDPAGWLYTGDLGYLNNHGYLYVVDRIKDMINRGGEKICSFDVENELHGLLGVAEAAVVGLPDEKYGEVPVALIQLEPDTKISGEQIRNALIPLMARYKVPVRFLFTDQIPRTPNGKTDKKAIRALFALQKKTEAASC